MKMKYKIKKTKEQKEQIINSNLFDVEGDLI